MTVDQSPEIARSSYSWIGAGVTVGTAVAVGFAGENGVALEQAKARAIISPAPANSICFVRIPKTNELSHAR